MRCTFLHRPCLLHAAATVPMWKAFRKVYGSEKAAIAAAEKNVIPILSFINTEANIRENWQVLQEKFDKDEARDIVTKNPGILANKAGDRNIYCDVHRHPDLPVSGRHMWVRSLSRTAGNVVSGERGKAASSPSRLGSWKRIM